MFGLMSCFWWKEEKYLVLFSSSFTKWFIFSLSLFSSSWEKGGLVHHFVKASSSYIKLVNEWQKKNAFWWSDKLDKSGPFLGISGTLLKDLFYSFPWKKCKEFSYWHKCKFQVIFTLQRPWWLTFSYLERITAERMLPMNPNREIPGLS